MSGCGGRRGALAPAEQPGLGSGLSTAASGSNYSATVSPFPAVRETRSLLTILGPPWESQEWSEKSKGSHG